MDPILKFNPITRKVEAGQMGLRFFLPESAKSFWRSNLQKHKRRNDINIGDGGFLDWTQRLTNNKKERIMASGLGLELTLKIMKGLG